MSARATPGSRRALISKSSRATVRVRARSPSGARSFADAVVWRSVPPDANGGGAQYCIRGRDVGAELDSPRGREIRQCGDVLAFRLDLLLQGHRAALPVDVRVPHTLNYDRRRGVDIVEEYLELAGFMQLPVLVEGTAS